MRSVLKKQSFGRAKRTDYGNMLPMTIGLLQGSLKGNKKYRAKEMRSCSMDIGGITPVYVQRAWGGRVAIEDIEAAFEELKRSDDLLCIGK